MQGLAEIATLVTLDRSRIYSRLKLVEDRFVRASCQMGVRRKRFEIALDFEMTVQIFKGLR